jgi:3-dehydroquinate dehydratase-1
MIMRLQRDTKIAIKNKVIGGPDYLICVPLLAVERSDLFQEAAALKQLDPDLLEWRIDAYAHAQDIDDSLDTLAELRKQVHDTPLIFTCRTHSQGGLNKLASEHRQCLLTEAIKTGYLDIVDIELSNDADFIQSIMETARNYGVRVILSYHNFETTPDEAIILETLLKAQNLGADIAKVAAMPKKYKDVLTLLSATLKAREQGLKIPAITISMGPLGRLSRIAGGLFGSDITFACGNTPSAPGQIPIEDLRQAMAALYS